jgi:8-oxo-dGTP pyrophosphatase MutT (NUDIX family)
MRQRCGRRLSESARLAAPGGPQRIPRPEGVRLGPGAWWSRAGATPPPTVPLARVRHALQPVGADLSPRPPLTPGAGAVRAAPEVADSVLDNRLPMADPRPSAVLCALFEEDGDTWVVLTRRSSRLRSHTGEIAFPGGRLDSGETAVAAALREAEEEVGLDPGTVEIIGELSPLATMSSRSAITPFVGVIDRRPHLRPNPAEVDRAFAVPLAELMATGVYHEERWTFPGGGDRAIHFFELPGETVWGATAMMLRDLLDRVYPVPT